MQEGLEIPREVTVSCEEHPREQTSHDQVQRTHQSSLQRTS